jgi:hypothetical protein
VARRKNLKTAAPQLSKKLKDGEIFEADGFDEAMIGIGHRCGEPPAAVYDANKCVQLLVAYSDMEFGEAYNYFTENVEAAWFGGGAPVWVYPAGLFDREAN